MTDVTDPIPLISWASWLFIYLVIVLIIVIFFFSRGKRGEEDDDMDR